MNRQVRTATFTAIAASLLAFAGGDARATDSVERLALAPMEDSEKRPAQADPAESRVSQNGPAVEADRFRLLHQIQSDVTARLQKKIEADLSRQVEQTLASHGLK